MSHRSHPGGTARPAASGAAGQRAGRAARRAEAPGDFNPRDGSLPLFFGWDSSALHLGLLCVQVEVWF